MTEITADDLKYGARSIAYEFAMLWRLADQVVAKVDIIEHGWALSNAALESFLLHFRGLREFLRSSSNDEDAILALDYGPAPTPWTEIVKGERDRLNKLLSHPSYSRRKLERHWDRPRIAERVRERTLDFLRSLKPESLELFATATMKALFPELSWPAHTIPDLDT